MGVGSPVMSASPRPSLTRANQLLQTRPGSGGAESGRDCSLSLVGGSVSGASSAVSLHSWAELWPWPWTPSGSVPPQCRCVPGPQADLILYWQRERHWGGSQQLWEMSPAHSPTCGNALMDIHSGGGSVSAPQRLLEQQIESCLHYAWTHLELNPEETSRSLKQQLESCLPPGGWGAGRGSSWLSQTPACQPFTGF